MGQKVNYRMKTCLITDPAKDAYCGEPATGTLYKLPACLPHRNELELRVLRDQLARLTERFESALVAQIVLSEASDRPATAKLLRELL